MKTLNADGTPRKKYTTKKMIMKKNRKNGQKKAWDTRKALYPETNGYKPKQVDVEATRMPMSAPIKKVDVPEVQPEKKEEVDVPSESVPSKSDDKKEDVLTAELAEKLANLDDFLNAVPGVEFNREEFIREALTIAVDTVIEGVVVIVTGKEALTKKLKGMMEFVEEA